MFQLVRETHIHFMRWRRMAYYISGTIFLIGIVSIFAHKGFNLGVDFEGGRLIEYRFNQAFEVQQIRGLLGEIGYGGAEIQSIGHTKEDFLVRLPVQEEQLATEDSPSQTILTAMRERFPGLEGDLRKEELVGPKVGAELKAKAFWAIVVALLGILIYVGWRYEFKFALGGVVALAHDVLVTLFVFSLLDLEISIPIIAALLTIGGYSINDTVVVFDRIREQSKLMQGKSMEHIIDLSINKTLSRTLITSVTTLFAALALYLLGGEVIHDFAFAMVIGIVVGTYSSIYVASALVLELSHAQQKRQRRAA